jgi:hypothetical protein
MPTRAPDPDPDPDPDLCWEIYYRDTFDRGCPPSVEARGRGLVQGLLELWSRHLYEGVREDGRLGFSRFNLWSTEPPRSVSVANHPAGCAKLRGWVFGSAPSGRTDTRPGGDRLLRLLASAHARLVATGGSSQAITAAAAEASDGAAFERQLMEMAGGD